MPEEMESGERMRKVRADRVGEFKTAYLKNREKIIATQSVCGICGKEVDKSLKYPHPLSAVVDHIIPLNKGGHPSDLNNLQLAHRWCNRQKSDKLVDIQQSFSTSNNEIKNDDLPLHFNWLKYTSKTKRQ